MIKKFLILTALTIALFWHFVPAGSPPGFTADEAAFGYNAYSIAQTGKDEYGTAMPLRLKSFGDYKLPLYSYVTAPIVRVFGLNELTTRLLTGIAAVIIVITVYVITKALFGNEYTAMLALYMSTFSPWIHTIARQAHESVLATALFAISLYAIIRFVQSRKARFLSIVFITLPLSLFAYHTAKLIVPTLLLLSFYYLLRSGLLSKSLARNTGLIISACFLVFFVGLFVLGEKQTPAERVKNLFIFNNPDIKLKTDQAKLEQRFSPFGLKLVAGSQAVVKRYVSYFSPEFLTQHGDVNNRFGSVNISPISVIQYLFFVIGLFALVRKWKPEYVGILMLLVVSPFNGALTWQEYALTRVFPMIVCILPIAAFGIQYVFSSSRLRYVRLIVIGAIIAGNSLSLFYFFVHYPQQAIAIRSMQAGNRELAQYIRDNYGKFDRFYITRDGGQPYIYLLFYLQYNPADYQQQATLSQPDEYGFGQVEVFDKFTFSTDSFNLDNPQPKSVYVFSQDGGRIARVPESAVKKIRVGTEEMFWIYETP